MRLIDADELMRQIKIEETILDTVFADDKNAKGDCLWNRKNEIVRIKGIIANIPTEEK